MSPFRFTLLIIIAVFALMLGALFALPVYRKNFAKVEINGAAVLVEVAADPRSRAVGLSGRESLSEFSGMLFSFKTPGIYGMWMKGMNFPIDIIWIKNGRVADIEEAAKPPLPRVADSFLPIYRSDVLAEFVLEVNAGFIKKHNVRIGDDVKIFWNDRVTVSADNFSAIPPPPPGYGYFIETLWGKPADGKDFKIGRLVSQNNSYRKFEISYGSGDLTISGVMNVPGGDAPSGGFPVLILNHGLIPPEIYFSGRGSKREQDFFARHGYITIHPDYRGYASSSPNTQTHHDFYVGYTEDVINLLDAIKRLNSDLLDADRIGMWGHSMGGGIATRMMVLRPEVRAYVLFAPISADAEDNFFELSEEEMGQLAETYGMGEEAREIYERISPLTYFSDVQAPVQIHHGIADKDVPIEFSEKIFNTLLAYGKKAEFFKYTGEGHEFEAAWPVAAERALQFFDKYVKTR